jgi:predicted PurR-regulated permease PerM
MDFSKLRAILFFGILTTVTVLFLFIISPFFLAIFWAAVIASIFYPLYVRLKKYLKNESISTLIVMLAVFFIIVIPLTFLSSLLIKESLQLYDAIDNNRSQISQSIQQTISWIQNNNYVGKLYLDEATIVEKLSDITKTITAFIFTSVKNLTQNSIVFLAMLLIMFYTLFFFIRDGEKMLKKIMYLSPLGDKNEELLYNKFTSTARATIRGTLLIGLIQGFLGAILFSVTGVQGAIIWAIIMTITAIIPAAGSYVIWLPAGIISLIIGDVWQGILILAFGFLIIGTIDNFLRPILVGKDTQIHPLLILFSTLGGILLFGISGFLIGPIITSFLLALWEMYAHHYRKELANN